jgi:hypothetical protein
MIWFRRRRQTLQQSRILERLGDQLLGAGLSIHVGEQIRKLRTRLEQLVQGIDLARHRGRREIVHAVERDIDAEVALARQGVRNLEGDARLHRFEPIVEVVDVDLEGLALGHRRKWLGRIARQVRHHSHHERQLDLLFGTVHFHVVFNLNPRRPVALYELLTAFLGHAIPPFDAADGSRSD